MGPECLLIPRPGQADAGSLMGSVIQGTRAGQLASRRALQ